MDRIVISIALIIFSISALSQARSEVSYEIGIERKHKVGVNIGGSAATGDFGNDDLYDENSGLASGGVLLNVNYQLRFNKNLTGTFLYGMNINSFNSQALERGLNRGDTIYNVIASPYLTVIGLVGLKATIGEKFRPYVNPVVGPAIMVTPTIDAESFYDYYETVTSDVGATFIYGASFGIDYNITELLSLNLDVLFLKGTFMIEDEYSLEAYELNYSTRNITVGVGLNF
jgi:hypothetical protein